MQALVYKSIQPQVTYSRCHSLSAVTPALAELPNPFSSMPVALSEDSIIPLPGLFPVSKNWKLAHMQIPIQGFSLRHCLQSTSLGDNPRTHQVQD